MENTYNYLKTVFQNLKHEYSQNPAVIFIILVFWTIPLGYALSSILIGLLFAVSIYTFKSGHFTTVKNLIFPITLFLLMGISLIWTHDFSASLRALSKGLPLLIIPFCFLLFPILTHSQKQKIFGLYSYGLLLFTVFCLIKATLRFVIAADSNVFFYHELVTEDINAIHVSVYAAMAIFYFITKNSKSVLDKMAVVILTLFLILLSSKNIIIVFSGLILFYYLSHYKSTKKNKILKISAFLILITAVIFLGKITDRFQLEYQANATEHSLNHKIGNARDKVYNVSMKQAWNQDLFQPNDYFPGTTFRVYQIRIFIEMLQEDPIFFTGYGLNATDFKISEKRVEHNLYEGYEKKNFHNEYIQIFAELGIFGLLLLLAMLFLNIKNAIKNKDFIHISFAVLMISLFLTESFLSRQRGIIFFTMMYCIFNTGIDVFAPNKNKKL